MDSLISAFVDILMEGMKKFLRRGDEVDPQVILFALEEGSPVIIPLIGIGEVLVSKEGLKKVRIIVTDLWKNLSSNRPELTLKAVLMLSDSWIKKVSEEEWEKAVKRKSDTPFVPKPGMAEGLVVQVSLHGMDILYEWSYVRGTDEIVFAPAPCVSNKACDTTGLVLGLWPL